MFFLSGLGWLHYSVCNYIYLNTFIMLKLYVRSGIESDGRGYVV